MLPIEIVGGLLEQFNPSGPKEQKLLQALREVIEGQSISPVDGKLCGQRVDITAIARRAQLRRSLISSEGCELQRVRDLILDVMKLLSEYSLQIECDYLREENKRLQVRLNKYDSEAANRVVLMFSERLKGAEVRQKRSTPSEVLKSVRVLHMSEISTKG